MMVEHQNKGSIGPNMSLIKGKNTKPEMLVRRFLFAQGFRYRLHERKLLGKPDIVLPKYKTIVFVNGCFWHGHRGCPYSHIPKTHSEWWLQKIKKNRLRDKYAEISLNVLGWRTITIWECQLFPKNINASLNSLCELIKGI